MLAVKITVIFLTFLFR